MEGTILIFIEVILQTNWPSLDGSRSPTLIVVYSQSLNVVTVQ